MRSFDAVKMVLDKAPKDLTPIQRLVLIQIAHKQPKCYATVGTLADDCGIRQEKTVSKAVKVLESKGLIAVNRRRYSSNEYVLLGRLMVGREIPDQLGRLTPSPDPHATPVKQTLNKHLNKEKKSLVFSSKPGSAFWDVVAKARPDLSFVERKEGLESFVESRDAWWIDNALTDEILLNKVLACFPSAEGKR
jgi:DNA-binding MarR family transcriptional regulator